MEKYRLIIVDDDEMARRGLSRFLDWASLGFQIDAELEDGADAIEYMEDHPADVILTDVCMHQVSGLDVAIWVRDNRPGSRVVILSGYEEFEYVRRAMQCQVCDYLLKPVKKTELTRVFVQLKEEMDRKRSAEKAVQSIFDERVEKEIQALAEAIAEDDGQRAAEAYDVLAVQLSDAGGAAAAAILVWMMNAIYQRLEQKDILMPEEWSKKAVGRRMEEALNDPEKIRALIFGLYRQRHAISCSGELGDRVRLWVDAHLSDDFTLDDLARALYMSSGHLSREFRRQTGESVMNYVIGRRMKKACALMQEKKYSQAQIARMVGYQDSHYFRKVFKKYLSGTEGQ